MGYDAAGVQNGQIVKKIKFIGKTRKLQIFLLEL